MSPISCYGSTKIANEYLLNDVAKTGDIDVVMLRYFNPVGSHSQSIIYDDPYASPNNLMPRVIRVALGIEEQMHIGVMIILPKMVQVHEIIFILTI